jgi:hypothetical protein
MLDYSVGFELIRLSLSPDPAEPEGGSGNLSLSRLSHLAGPNFLSPSTVDGVKGTDILIPSDMFLSCPGFKGASSPSGTTSDIQLFLEGPEDRLLLADEP